MTPASQSDVQGEYHFTSTSFSTYHILTAFNKLKIMSKVAHDNWKRLTMKSDIKTFKNTNFIDVVASRNH